MGGARSALRLPSEVPRLGEAIHEARMRSVTSEGPREGVVSALALSSDRCGPDLQLGKGELF